MGAGEQQAPGRSDKRFIEVGLAQGHIGAVAAKKDQRKVFTAFNTEHDQRGEPAFIRVHMADVDTGAAQFFADKPAHMFIAHPGQQGGLQAEPGGAEGDIRRAAAKVLGEAADIFQPAADLLRVEVHGGASQADQIACFLGIHSGLHSARRRMRPPRGRRACQAVLQALSVSLSRVNAPLCAH